MRLLFDPQFAAPTAVAGSIAHGGRLWLNRDAQRAEVHLRFRLWRRIIMADPIHVALIDDDEAVRDSLQLYFKRKHVRATCFQAAEDFLEIANGCEPFDCIIADVRMPRMSGLDLVQHLKSRRSICPVILITGHGDVDMAVSAVKAGACDFIEKPFDETRLLTSVHDAVEKGRQRLNDEADVEQMKARFELLSTRQRQVMELAAAGLSNKEIGTKLNISPRTVENHRAWVMARIGARNVAELVRVAMRIGMPV
jgi:two-component system response regulator FixJ